MPYQLHPFTIDIESYLALHEHKDLLRLLTCGSVDAGKSTLIGRLLLDAKLIYADQLKALKADSMISSTVGNSFDLTLLVDGLQAEREQGITIDVAHRYFSTTRRKFIIADTPGHDQYTRNMVTGASTCDLAIILIDARKGVRTQTRRHTALVSLLGIKQAIVAINKMDLVDYSEDRFNAIKSDFLKFASPLKGISFKFIPLSALTGDNVVNPGLQMPWFEGKPLMSLLETMEIATHKNATDFRYSVQYVNCHNDDFNRYCGTVASGTIHKGDDIIVLPSAQTSRVQSIFIGKEELEMAHADIAITLTLEDKLSIHRGDIIVHPQNRPILGRSLTATVVWMAEQPLLPGRSYDFKLGTRMISGTIHAICHCMDVNTLKCSPAQSLTLNEIGQVEISFSECVCFDSYLDNRATGSFIFIDQVNNVTVGAGMIIGNHQQ